MMEYTVLLISTNADGHPTTDIRWAERADDHRDALQRAIDLGHVRRSGYYVVVNPEEFRSRVFLVSIPKQPVYIEKEITH